MREITRADLTGWLPRWPQDVFKQQRGHLWICGGGIGTTGAPRLAAHGALAMGVGLVSLLVPDEVYGVVASAELEVMVHPDSSRPPGLERADAVVAGPGWGLRRQEALRALLAGDRPLLLDADALNLVAREEVLAALLAARRAPTVLTPHPGEAARLLGLPRAAEVQRDRPAALAALVARFRCTVVLKGARTRISSGEDVWVCPLETNRLATAGSGDVLAGMIGALLAQGVAAPHAAACGVGLHALAGARPGWYRAGMLPDLVARLREELCGGDRDGRLTRSCGDAGMLRHET